jgi:hypothetical protein
LAWVFLTSLGSARAGDCGQISEVRSPLKKIDNGKSVQARLSILGYTTIYRIRIPSIRCQWGGTVWNVIGPHSSHLHRIGWGLNIARPECHLLSLQISVGPVGSPAFRCLASVSLISPRFVDQRGFCRLARVVSFTLGPDLWLGLVVPPRFCRLSWVLLFSPGFVVRLEFCCSACPCRLVWVLFTRLAYSISPGFVI